MTGDAVADRPHSTGIGGHVPAQRTALLTRRDGIDKPERRELAVELFQRHARLHHCDLVLRVDLADPFHAVEGQQDAVGQRDRCAREAGAAATGHHRHLELAGQLQDLGHLAGGPGKHDGPGDNRHRRERLVVGVVGVDGLTHDHMVLADGLTQLFQELGHGMGHPHLGSIGWNDLTVCPEVDPRFTGRLGSAATITSHGQPRMAARAATGRIRSLLPPPPIGRAAPRRAPRPPPPPLGPPPSRAP